MLKLPFILIPYRDEIYKEAWKKYKNKLTMKDLAIILRVHLPRLFQILKGK